MAEVETFEAHPGLDDPKFVLDEELERMKAPFAERRCRQMKALGRFREMQILGDGDDVPQMPQLYLVNKDVHFDLEIRQSPIWRID